jgi:hypothetical protein
MPKTAKFIPKKKKTLTPEPNWTKLRKAKTEEERLVSWSECEDFVHYEVTDKEVCHSIRRWIETDTDWNLTEEAKALPDTYLLSFAKNGWKARQLGFMPQSVEETLRKDLKPLVERGHELRSRVTPDSTDFSDLPDDYWLHPTKVKIWLKDWKKRLTEMKSWEESKDSNLRMQYQITQTYVYNMNIYLRTGYWGDSHFGANREGKVMTVCKVLAFDSEGMVKRTVGTYYPDIGTIWTQEDQNANR